jgi:hypothetical protein
MQRYVYVANEMENPRERNGLSLPIALIVHGSRLPLDLKNQTPIQMKRLLPQSSAGWTLEHVGLP